MRMRAKASGLLLGLATTALVAAAHAVVVERIVAIVGDRAVLLSELRDRARPFLEQIQQKVPPGAQQAAAESQVLKDLVAKIVEEELESQAAAKAHVVVTDAEIDGALANVAQSQGITPAQLVHEAETRTGLREREYREELRRQLIEGKMVQLRVRGRVRITDEDVKAMFDRTVREERGRRAYRASWIVLRLMPGSSEEATRGRAELAATLAKRAKSGEDFAELARQNSDDVRTRDVGGDLGARAPSTSPDAASGKLPVLAPDLEQKLLALEPGEASDPIRYADAFVVLKLVTRQPSRYEAGFEAAKPEMMNRLQSEVLDRAKKKWLEELRARTHVAVRL